MSSEPSTLQFGQPLESQQAEWDDIPPPSVGMTFESVESIKVYRDNASKKLHLDLNIFRSDYKFGKMTITCKHSGEYRNTRKNKGDGEGSDNNSEDGHHDTNEDDIAKSVITQRFGCPYELKLNRRKNGIWYVTKIVGEHNHRIARTLTVYARNRKPTPQQYESIVELIDAGAKNRVVKDAMKMKYKNHSNLTSKDVANIRFRLSAINAQQEERSIGRFIKHLSKHGYDVSWATNEADELTYFFYTHDIAIKHARRFPEVVIVDATYKTVNSKFPFVNMVGVANVGLNDSTLMTFGMAGGWICREDTNAYTWLLNKLKSSVFPSYLDCQPGLFITDEEQALMKALGDVFPGTPTMLCYIHLRRNFRNAVRPLFHGSKAYQLAETAFYNLVNCRDEHGFIKQYNNYTSTLNNHIIHPQTGLTDVINVKKAKDYIDM
jgi:hypothetical protein